MKILLCRASAFAVSLIILVAFIEKTSADTEKIDEVFSDWCSDLSSARDSSDMIKVMAECSRRGKRQAEIYEKLPDAEKIPMLYDTCMDAPNSYTRMDRLKEDIDEFEQLLEQGTSRGLGSGGKRRHCRKISRETYARHK